ncbi:MAG: fibrillarin-like rRNA/tRNA 2'-O-methyltransferase [Thaumarchaeota archaeon]|nr:fibrillarin-like rRNA/tRNA 2'-O-methyltransferase [Nitrososphaerota archaeon]MDE0265756.1 fibrillarin-like rRNA/tRNA 2'-O-methyltransferase [Nitrososphaerota archaeon]MDE0525114.1 fibrillarin-like rRNA/tRNA 2'-O-methyltransferase [Nitrososphaerota archaeon]
MAAPEPFPPFILTKFEGRDRPATENQVPGNRVYGEKLLVRKKTEYRIWDPFRSKLAAAVMNGLETFPFGNGSRILYLGVSTGTTASHISDMIGKSGVLFGIEHASRVARDFMDRVASHRPNIIPVMQDARMPGDYFAVFGKVDVVYVDIAQPDQTAIAMANCRMFLERDRYLFLVIKTRSIDVVKEPWEVIRQETEKLSGEFEIVESINLEPYDKDHAMVVARYPD